ncbi:MAG: arsenate reductase (glutaredoxin), partial [Rhodobacteraceae bacterium]|nr:arsenate reductase (glutaredoxin) [Paracoccaceae bacterium]
KLCFSITLLIYAASMCPFTNVGKSALSLLIAFKSFKESAFREAGLSKDSSEDALLAAMAAHPELIERPIAIRGMRAILGRPPEDTLALLD